MEEEVLEVPGATLDFSLRPALSLDRTRTVWAFCSFL